jgi:hypothetical protein
MRLTKAQFGWLRWLRDNGGSGYVEGHRVVAGGEQSLTNSAISFLKLVVVGALAVKDGRLVITEYGQRLLTP